MGDSAGLAASRVEIVSGINAGQETTTDPEGRYRFEALRAGEFVVRASAEGYQPQTAGVTLDADKTRDFILPRRPDAGRATLSGRVTDASAVDPDESGLADAQVAITSGANAGRTAVTDADGRYALEDLAIGGDAEEVEEVVVEASKPGYATESNRVRLSGEQTVDFSLNPETGPAETVSLSGRVTVDAPAAPPVPAARVTVTIGPDAGRATTTDAEGRYRLEGLSPQPLVLEVSAPGYVTETRTVTPDETGQPVDIRLERAAEPVTTTGRVVDVLSDAGLEGIVIDGDTVGATQSGPDGVFSVTAANTAALQLLEFAGADIVARRTWLYLPEEIEPVISLIPRSFDLEAFDEMLRTPVLRRWTAAPPLVIQRRVLEFTDVDMTEALASDVLVSDEEAQSLLDDLTWALPQLTGGRFDDFYLVSWQTAAPEAAVPLLNSGVITVVRVSGLADATGAWGWSRWLFGSNGVVVGGLVMLDDAFERSGSPYLRSLRAHELGHALGYAHVSATVSVMNADARLEPTSFDLDATRIAFDRPPGNRAPDVDPEPAQAPQRVTAPAWSDPIR